MKVFRFIIISILCCSSFSSYALNFREAKVELRKIYKHHPTTFYCDCDISWVSNKKLIPDLNSCNYTPRKQPERANRIEFEHIVSAWEFGHQRQCWQKGKRKYCQKHDAMFNKMEGDLHNLVPTVGEVNGDRSNYRFNIIEGEPRVYGACDAEVHFKRRVFEPRDSVRGDIARTYFYFEKQYSLRISKSQKKLFAAWNKLDPVDENECQIHSLKTKIQGNSNPFVENRCNKP